MRERELKDRVPYSQWVRDGKLFATPGNVIDYKFIIQKIKDLAEVYEIREVAFDRWGSPPVTQALQEDEVVNLVQFGQGYVSMAAPTKELLNLVLGQKLAHGNHPVLTWNISNTMVKQDPAGNLKPDKQKSREKIDGVVAMIMGLSRALVLDTKPAGNYYADHDLLVI